MRNFFAAIGRFLAALPRLVLQRVFEAGRWVMRLMSAPPADAPAAPMPPPDEPESLDMLRTAAGVLAQGRSLEPQHIMGLSETRIAWLKALDRRQLCVVLSRDNADLRQHLAGKIRLPGLPAADRTTVAALTEARKPRPTPRGYRTMRDRLAELEAEKADEEPASTWAPAL